MEKINSRTNSCIRHLRALAADGAYRHESGEFLCDGMKLLREALSSGAAVRRVLWKDGAEAVAGLEGAEQLIATAELFDYASPMKNSPGPLFTVALPVRNKALRVKNALVLDGVQDPGNVGTVIRSANAFGIEAVLLTGGCADLYNPKTVRATMGAIFRQQVFQLSLDELGAFLKENELPLYGAALSDKARDVRGVDIRAAAVAVGSEGSGLSGELLSLCRGEIIIPMQPCSESLNAAVAAAVLMWEMSR